MQSVTAPLAGRGELQAELLTEKREENYAEIDLGLRPIRKFKQLHQPILKNEFGKTTLAREKPHFPNRKM